MPFYAVLLHGEGVHMPCSDGGRPIAGFYTSRVVWARTESLACEKALQLVRMLWESVAYKVQNQGRSPILSVESCERATIARWLSAPKKGHTFYPEEERVV
jgi:hypothetical protein